MRGRCAAGAKTPPDPQYGGTVAARAFSGNGSVPARQASGHGATAAAAPRPRPHFQANHRDGLARCALLGEGTTLQGRGCWSPLLLPTPGCLDGCQACTVCACLHVPEHCTALEARLRGQDLPGAISLCSSPGPQGQQHIPTGGTVSRPKQQRRLGRCAAPWPSPSPVPAARHRRSYHRRDCGRQGGHFVLGGAFWELSVRHTAHNSHCCPHNSRSLLQ